MTQAGVKNLMGYQSPVGSKQRWVPDRQLA